MEFPLNTLLTVIFPAELTNFTTTEALLINKGIPDAVDFLRQARVNHPEYGWNKWVVEKVDGPVTGKWTSRFAKLWKQTKGVKFDAKILSEIGEQLTLSNPNNTAYFEICKQIEWNAGDFGDGGSCWFNTIHPSYAFRTKFLASGRGYALKFFRNEAEYTANRNRGMGRCWMGEQGEHLFFWNGRGGSISTKYAAKVIATYLKTDFTLSGFTVKNSYKDGDGYIVGINPIAKQGTVLEF